MRELTSHKVNGCNEALAVTATDNPGHGGACHEYLIFWNRPTRDGEPGAVTGDQCNINFQNGPIAEVGTNGVAHESLLAILIDRLEGFQSGNYQCEENAAALRYLNRAMDILKQRTMARLARGVEGTHKV